MDRHSSSHTDLWPDSVLKPGCMFKRIYIYYSIYLLYIFYISLDIFILQFIAIWLERPVSILFEIVWLCLVVKPLLFTCQLPLLMFQPTFLPGELCSHNFGWLNAKCWYWSKKRGQPHAVCSALQCQIRMWMTEINLKSLYNVSNHFHDIFLKSWGFLKLI